MNELDILYGPCLEAGRLIEPLELQYRPNSLQPLTDAAADGLGRYLDSAACLEIPRVMHRQMVILWVMDGSGTIFIAFEELIHCGTGAYLMPYFRTNLVTAQLKNEIDQGRMGRLGHPSLLTGDRHARIGGEIRFRPDDEDEHLWKINRSSGRYGLRPHQTDAHLSAVHSLFADKGLHLGIE